MKKSSNYQLLMAELKKILKNKRIRYSSLSLKLGISESSVKRTMTASDGALSKIEAICEVVGISFFDLATTIQKESAHEYQLSPEQDKFFSKNTNYFYLFHLMYEMKMTVKQVMKKYQIKALSMTKYLKKLEQLGLLERHANDKIVFLIEGYMTVGEKSGLGKHLIQTTVNNLSSIVGDAKNFKGANDEKGSFTIGEYLITKESADKFMQSFGHLQEELSRTNEREEKVYNIEDLIFYTCIFSFLPKRLYYEDIPNI
ncbi:MAG: helix-turn-helix transcriptional regulator [Halobacteriovoraceae bacterium]|mgnify:CR=1 FL=1|jgi:hypothetical protein|nr:helix-turn-helix transcriptional regulator [Halobacteriovoraceae bacterium]MBT5095089.1 helix-turn-helix transcriptional regulator [Halobacteriovoraceae bacterium]